MLVVLWCCSLVGGVRAHLLSELQYCNQIVVINLGHRVKCAKEVENSYIHLHFPGQLTQMLFGCTCALFECFYLMI